MPSNTNPPPAKGAHWRGHFFLFGRKPAASYGDAAGLRLLLVFAVFEWLLGPRLHLFTLLHLQMPEVWFRTPFVLAAVLLAVRILAGVKFADIGLYCWRSWNPTEKSYFVQVLVIANVVFVALVAPRLQAILTAPTALAQIETVFIPYLFWGFYQEVVYRGILQTELVRRWGATAGVLAANTLFAFGPLHLYHLAAGSASLPVFGAIFAIGLFFGVLFQRSGNLWMVAVFHGIGNMYLDGTS